MKTIVSVTKEHIAQGKRENAGSCPIALAVKSLLPVKKTRQVRVYTDQLKLTRVIRKSALPLEAKNFILKFDSGKDVEPFSFLVDIPKTHLRKKFLS